MPKNIQTMAPLCSFCMLVRLCSKSFKLALGSVKQELPDVQAGFRKGRGTRDQIASFRWIIQKAREFQKNIYICFIDYTKAFDCVDHNKLWKILKEMGIWPLYLSPEQVKKQQLEPYMEQLTGSKLRKEYNKAIYCHPVCLTYMQSISCEMPTE